MVEMAVLHRLFLPMATLLHRADLHGCALHQLQDPVPWTRLEDSSDWIQEVAYSLGVEVGRMVMDAVAVLRLDQLGVRQATRCELLPRIPRH